MKLSIVTITVAVVICSRCLQPDVVTPISSVLESGSNWILKWSDEFNGRDGQPPDKTKWAIETGGNGWGNNELEYYTARLQNIREQDGNLIIEANEERFVGSDGLRRGYTSGRLNTSGRFSQKYGRFEARIKTPSGSGVWPAFWLLGNDYSEVGWPSCGEIDIMEEIGSSQSMIHGSVHGPGYAGRHALTSSYVLPSGNFNESFHVFALEWEPAALHFYVDGQMYATKTPGDLPEGTTWVFDHPFFLVLNLAVRGDMPRDPGPATAFPQRMLVDYVRVYSRK